MPILGPQEVFLPGLEFAFQRDPIDGVEQPYVKLGTIAEVSPDVSTDEIELRDFGGGRRRVVDKRTVRFRESYQIRTFNLNPENLALAFSAAPPQAFVQAAAGFAPSHVGHNGHLLKLAKADGTLLYGIAAVGGVFKTAIDGSAELVTTGTVVDAGAKTIKIQGDHTATVTNGKKFVLGGGGTLPASLVGAYTVASSSFGSGVTTVTVTETPAATASAVGAGCLAAWGASANLLAKDTDWEVPSEPNSGLERGFIRFLGDPSGNSPLTGGQGTVFPVFSTKAIANAAGTPGRLIHPLSVAGEVKGLGFLYLSRENYDAQSVREARVAIKPAGAQFPARDYASVSLDVTIITDPTAAERAGRLIHFLGDLPAVS